MSKDTRWLDETELKDKRQEITSPSGRFKLTIRYYDNGKGYWNYTQGVVHNLAGKKIGSIKRNYSSFNYGFITIDGHELLVSGEDYTSQTVLDLDTGKKYQGPKRDAAGFCWAALTPHDNYMIVCGCHWACPYEFRVYDFSNILKTGKWPELKVLDENLNPSYIDDDDSSKKPTIIGDTFEVYHTIRIHKELGMTENEVELKEQRLSKNGDNVQLIPDDDYDDKDKWDVLIDAITRYKISEHEGQPCLIRQPHIKEVQDVIDR